MGASTVAVAITAAERRIVRRLRAAGARSAATAQPLTDLRWFQARRVERLVDAGALVETAPGTYYVDDAAYDAMRGDRRAVALAMFLLVTGSVGLLLFLINAR